VSKLVHASGEATRDHIFSRTDIPSVGVSFEVLPIRCYAGGDTLHLMMCQGRMGFASNVSLLPVKQQLESL
jgi:hypothetical protein